MASNARYCPSCLSSLASSLLPKQTALSHSLPPAFLLPTASQHNLNARHASSSSNAASSRSRRKDQPAAAKRKKTRTTYQTHDLKKIPQFSLVDAMRFLRAAEVGREPNSAKYELHIKLSTPKNGAVVRNRVRLPHAVRTDLRIAVICAEDSAAAAAARAAGAALVGEDSLFDAIKAGNLEFDRCLCHADSLPKLAKAGVARILGPRGLMPSAKTGTVVKDVAGSVREMVGGSEYRERVGVVRMAVGQLGFAPEELQRNIRAFVASVKKDIAGLSDRIVKDVHEVVLSSTHGPGLSLSGELRGAESVATRDVSTM